MSYLERAWCGLTWAPWVGFKSSRREWKTIPEAPGVYRVRPVGQSFLMYIGQTGRGLRERLGELRSNALAVVMPYDDPHTAAPNLWAWKQEENWEYESSAVPTNLPERDRKALECYLLWQYRLERRESTLCNHGRFNEKYLKPSVRKKGRQGRKLFPNEPPNLAGGPSHPPLCLEGDPLDRHWMTLDWGDTVPLTLEELGRTPHCQALYRIVDLTTKDILYLGQTKDLRNRLMSHRPRYKEKESIDFSYYRLPETIRSYQRLELENDLIGGYYAQVKRSPSDQFGR